MNVEPESPLPPRDTIPPWSRLVPVGANAYGRFKIDGEDPDPRDGRRGRSATGSSILPAVGRNFSESGRVEAMARFCVDIGLHGTVRHACRVVGISRDTYLDWKHKFIWFASALESAQQDFNDRLEEEITRRATRGTLRRKAVFYKGDLVDEHYEREYSDLLLIFQAKRRIPEYRDKVEVTDSRTPIDWKQAQDMLKGIPDDYQPGGGRVEGGSEAPAMGPPGSPDPVLDGVFRDVREGEGR